MSFANSMAVVHEVDVVHVEAQRTSSMSSTMSSSAWHISMMSSRSMGVMKSVATVLKILWLIVSPSCSISCAFCVFSSSADGFRELLDGFNPATPTRRRPASSAARMRRNSRTCASCPWGPPSKNKYLPRSHVRFQSVTQVNVLETGNHGGVAKDANRQHPVILDVPFPATAGADAPAGGAVGWGLPPAGAGGAMPSNPARFR